jgi:UDP-N-acetyl-2-amino-2-deoxyglucuronate dehydrogenase
VIPPRTERPVGVALVGTGMWATQIAAAAARAGLRLVTCFSRDAGRRAAFAGRVRCGAAPSLRAALAHPEVEAAMILTPNDTHLEVALECAERGVAVFVEKPIADTVADAERIADSCAAAGVTLMVGHAFRRLGAARRVRELVDDGALGRVVLAEANLSLPGALAPDKWRAHRERGPGGPLMQLGIHHVDTLASWLGPPVSATGRFAHVATDADIDDVGVVTMQMASGALAAVTGSYVSPKTFAIRLCGTGAVLDYRADFGVWPAAERLDAVTTLTVDGAPVAFEERDMLAEELAEFARCARTGAAPATGAAEANPALRTIRDALAAAEEDPAWQPAPR